MSSRGTNTSLVMVLVAMICMRAMAQSGCSSVIISLAPCLNYVTGSSPTPTPSCCSQLASVVQSQPRCLCDVLSGGASSLGVTINQTLALALPSACQVQTPPVSECNAVHGPATSPLGSLPASPKGPPNYPTDDSSPTGGSKTVPGTGGNSSNGNGVDANMFFQLVVFVASALISL